VVRGRLVAPDVTQDNSFNRIRLVVSLDQSSAPQSGPHTDPRKNSENPKNVRGGGPGSRSTSEISGTSAIGCSFGHRRQRCPGGKQSCVRDFILSTVSSLIFWELDIPFAGGREMPWRQVRGRRGVHHDHGRGTRGVAAHGLGKRSSDCREGYWYETVETRLNQRGEGRRHGIEATP
jgi:hypothetical protein